MKKNIIWTCTFCQFIPTAQSRGKCPKCGRKLTPCDLNNMPLERKPEWPIKENEQKHTNEFSRIDYSKFYTKKQDKD